MSFKFSRSILVLGIILMPCPAMAATGSVSINNVGSIKIGTTTATCNSSLGGVVRYSSATGVLDFCNGSNWVSSLLPSTTALSSCTSGNLGALRFNSTGTTSGSNSNYVESCNGATWAKVGQIAGGGNGYVLFNSGGLLGTTSLFAWDNAGGYLTVGSGYQIGGSNALRLTTSGNPIVGLTAMSSTLAPLSIGVGRDSLASVTAEVQNVAVGYQALKSNLTGMRNTAVGQQALYTNTTGSDNTAGGNKALFNNSTGNENTAMGADAMSGCGAPSTQTGNYNTAGGSSALCSNTTGSSNTAFGRRALYLNRTGSYNTAYGAGALAANVSGNYNTGFGWGALALSTGSYNTAYGYNAGSNLTVGDNNIAIGANVNFVSATGSNQINIGNLIYGDTSRLAMAVGTSNFTQPFMAAPPSNETIASGATITANGCGTIKPITAAGAVTTHATVTYTAAAAANKGCCMDVINVGANAITLKGGSATNFLTSTGADLVLSANYAVRVCSNGTKWYQTMVMSPNL